MSDTRSHPPSLAIPGIDDLEPIGRGGFGTVYSGWQAALRRRVAVKVLDPAATDAEAEARFQREVMAMGSVSDHPNVVPVYASGTVDHRHFLVMPLLPDGSLADEMEHGPLSPPRVIGLGIDMADALAAAHQAGVLHRDVKPGNVLRTPYGSYQLADFGVARLADSTQTMGGSLLATVAYAPPEVLAGGSATEASDVYSLGATLHAALRGRPPYEAGSDDAPISLAVRVMNTEPPDLREAGVPPALVEVVERAMAREVQDRWSSAADLRTALQQLDLDAVAPGPAPAIEPRPDATVPLVAAPAIGPPPDTDTVLIPEGAPSTAVRTTGRGRSKAWALAALVVMIVGAAALLARQDPSGQPSAALGPSGASSTTAVPSPSSTPPTTASPATPPPSTAPPSTTPPTPTTAVAADPAGTAPPATSAAAAIRSYYALLDAGRLDEGWARLSPAYQDRTGEASYRGFWQSIAGVEVLEAGGDGLEGRAVLRYTRQDGTTSTEGVVLRFVRDPGGGDLLVDDYRVG